MGKTLIDEKSLTQNIGQKSLNLPPQYNARRQALKNLEKEFKALLTKRQNGTITKKELGRFRNLPREIKAVTITDPEVLFKRNRQGKWTYTKEEAWKLKGKASAPGLKPPETHHKAGLDKYYGKIKGWDDDVLFNLHESLASKGKYLGNHPKNRVNLDSSLHVGRARQFTPAYESIHGAIDYSDLTDAEWETLVDKVSSENIDYIKTDNLDFDFDSDIGSPGDPKVGRRPRTPIPSDEAFDYATSENFERLESMLDNDYQLADEFSKKAPNTKIAWEGKTASSRVTNFVKNNKANEAFWPEDTLDALKNQDLDRLVAIEKEIPLIKEAAMQDALKSGKTLQQWQAIAKNGENGANGTNGVKKLINTSRVLPLTNAVKKTANFVKPVAKPVLKVAPYAGLWLAVEGMNSGISKAVEDPTPENIAYATGKTAAAVLEVDPTGITPTIVDTATESFFTEEGRKNWRGLSSKYDFSSL